MATCCAAVRARAVGRTRQAEPGRLAQGHVRLESVQIDGAHLLIPGREVDYFRPGIAY
jgi:hypothetical protein